MVYTTMATKPKGGTVAETDSGVVMMAVRKDVARSLISRDSSYTPLQTDTTGALRVRPSPGCSSEAAIPAGTPSGSRTLPAPIRMGFTPVIACGCVVIDSLRQGRPQKGR
jgi:hypothetical protein